MAPPRPSAPSTRLAEALRWLEGKGSARVRTEQRTRYGITARKAFGVPVGSLQVLAKRLGRDRWARDFDIWGVCHTVPFTLFDQSPHAWAKVARWSRSREEFVKRAGFALLASLAPHEKTAPPERFENGLALIEQASGDDRHFVKKGVSWALRSIGRKPSPRASARRLAERLAGSSDPTARWIGRDSTRDLSRR